MFERIDCFFCGSSRFMLYIYQHYFFCTIYILYFVLFIGTYFNHFINSLIIYDSVLFSHIAIIKTIPKK